jgi:hypothetical protein
LLNIVSSSSEKCRFLHCDLGNDIFFQILSNDIFFLQVSFMMKIKQKKEEEKDVHYLSEDDQEKLSSHGFKRCVG